jgi:hypothetical protein
MKYRPGPVGAVRKESMIEENSESEEVVITEGDMEKFGI